MVHPKGNWLVDSPRFTPHLLRRFEAMGGIRYIILTHEDDVADAARFASHFGASRIIHCDDSPAQPEAEIQIDGVAPVVIEPDFRIIPTPGHTRGHLRYAVPKALSFHRRPSVVGTRSEAVGCVAQRLLVLVACADRLDAPVAQ
jgi:glyoxylase-like metal-dependent hydrolase (beta-lactamase superfamily II)